MQLRPARCITKVLCLTCEGSSRRTASASAIRWPLYSAMYSPAPTGLSAKHPSPWIGEGLTTTLSESEVTTVSASATSIYPTENLFRVTAVIVLLDLNQLDSASR